MMFASKSPEEAGFEPRPYRFYFSGQSLTEAQADVENWPRSHEHIYLDRENQWHALQHNEPNPILRQFRDARASWGEGEACYLAGMWLADIGEWNAQGEMQIETTPEQVDHARRVLEHYVEVYDV